MSRKEQIKTLWQACFDDTDASLQYFFNEIYKEENAISLEVDGRIVSVLQLLPYRMQWCGTEIPVTYIYAACTAPDERGKGYMGKLLEKSFAIMSERGILFNLLMPADDGLFEYYRGHGYTEVLDYSQETYTRDRVSRAERKHGNCLPVYAQTSAQWYPFFDRMLRKRPISILHSAENFRTLTGDIWVNDGMVLGVRNEKDEPTGLVFTSINEKDQVYIKELLVESEEVEYLLVNEVMRQHGLDSITCITPPRLPNCSRLGMGRIIDREAMIRILTSQGVYSASEIRDIKQMDIPELTAFLMDYHHWLASASLLPD